MRLLDYSKNVTSQFGEDGVIEKILSMLPNIDNWCVEFGAFDGKHLSNTYNLVKNFEYKAVLIEGDRIRFDNLKKLYSSNRNIILFNQWVGFEQKNSLDKILKQTEIPKNFDFLSIDIDGNDFHVWNAVILYSPKIVCIEYNPTIPTELEYVQPADSEINQGSSLRSLVKLASTKGYMLVAVTTANAFFVHIDYASCFPISDNSPESLREDLSYITYVFCGFDGSVHQCGCKLIWWHQIPHQIYQVPKLFRTHPEKLGPIRKLLFRLYRKWKIS